MVDRFSMWEREREPTPTFVLSRRSTALVERPARDASVSELGPYRLDGEIREAPGAWLWSGKNQEGRRVLLQLLRLRVARDDAARAERLRYEKTLGAGTALIAEAAWPPILAHGAVDGVHGERTLFWAMPWVDGLDARETERAPRTWAELAAVGYALARYLKERHDRELTDPSLTERSLVISPDRQGAKSIGMPLLLSSPWLAPGMSPSRLAPEENRDSDPTKQGDLWRLGCALKVLSVSIEGEPPGELTSLLRALTEIDPRRRLRRAADVMAELLALADEAPEITIEQIESSEVEMAWLPGDPMISGSVQAVAEPPKSPEAARNEPNVTPNAAVNSSRPPRRARRSKRPGAGFWIASSVLGVGCGAAAQLLARILG